MPRLPDASDRRPTYSTERRVLQIGEAGAGAALQKVGKSLRHAGEMRFQDEQKALEADDRLAYARAKTHITLASLQAQDALRDDQDFDTYEQKYTTAMHKARQESLELIKNPRDAEAFGIEVDAIVGRGEIDVKDMYRRKSRDYGRATIDTEVDSIISAAVASDDETATGLLHNANLLVDGGLQKGWYTAEEAAARRQTASETWAVSRLERRPVPERLKILKGARDNTEGMIVAAAEKHGVDADMMRRFAVLESGGDATAVNKQSGAAGLYQFMPATAKEYELKNPLNAAESADAAARLTKRNSAALKQSLGRAPAPHEAYLAHQQGAQGAAALLKADADKTAVDALEGVYGSKEKAEKAILQNGGTADMSAADFVALWKNRYNAADPDKAAYFGKTGTEADFLSPARRMAMLKEAKGIQAAEIRAGMQQIDDARKLGVRVDRSVITGLIGTAIDGGYAKEAESLQNYLAIQDEVENFGASSFAEQKAALAKTKEKLAGGNLKAVDTYAAMQNVYETKLKYLKDGRGWEYYSAHGLVDMPEPANMTNPLAVAEAVRMRREDIGKIAGMDGITLNPLLPQEVEQIKQAYQTGKPEETAQYITSINKALTRDETRALTQVIAKGENAAPILAAAINQTPDVARGILAGEKLKGEISKDKLRKAVNENFSGMVFGDAEAFEGMQGIIYAYYKYLSAQEGDLSPEVDTGRMERAVTDTIGQVVEFDPSWSAANSRVFSYRKDNGAWASAYDLEDIFGNLTNAALTETNGSLPVYAMDGAPIDAEDITDNFTFRSAGDGLYVALNRRGEYAANPDGSPYVFDARKLDETIKQSKASAREARKRKFLESME